MQNTVVEAINLLVTAFSSKFDDFHGVYLYGIFLDGKNHKNKDIELVAIFDVENKLKREIIWPIVGKIETDLDVFIDLNPTTMENLKLDRDLYDEIMINGKFFKPVKMAS